jgi:predicted heme/steroid binding protein
MGKTKDLGHLAHIVAYDAENHITVPAGITMHTNQLVASQAYVDAALGSYVLSSSLSSYVPASRTITINGTTYDLSANREWNITSMIYPAAGIALSTGSAWGTSITNNSANWNTAYGWGNHASAGYLTGITSTQVTTALGFTPVTNARTITINGTAFDLSANRSWTVSGTDATKLPLAGGTMTGNIEMATSGTSYIRMGRFPNVTTNSGEAWIGRASDRSAGTMTVQLGSANSSFFEVVDYGWTTVTLKVGMNDFSYKGNTIYHAGNVPTWNQNTTGSSGSVSGLTLTNSGSGINPDSVTQNQIGYNTSVSLFGQSDGGLYSSAYNSSWIHQIYGDFRTGQIAIRGKNSGSWTGWRTVIDSGNIGSQSVNYASSAGSASSASSSTTARYFPTYYVGGQQTNPQVYFNSEVGLNVAMTGAWSVWSDTLWVNGYAGGDVPWMCALHFLRNGEPRFAISAQQRQSTGYGSYYEVITAYNIASQTVANLSGFNKSEPTFSNVYNTGWFRNYGDSGLYNQDYGCHIARNSQSSHGSWSVWGYTKAGYVGMNLQDPQGYNNNLMYEQGRGGCYQENGGGWHYYYDRPNDCLGLSGSETYDWVRACTNGKHRITNDTWCDATSWAYTFSNISDGRLKENITTVDSALEKVLQLRGVYYNWIIDTENKKHIGLIAQETAAVCPEVVNYHEETDTYSVNYSELSGLFVESTKELNQKLMDANARIELLETKLNQLLNA